MNKTLKFSALEIAKIARDIESIGKQFYQHASETADIPEHQNLFTYLMNAESKHFEIFENFYKEIDKILGANEDSLDFIDDPELTSYLNQFIEGVVFPGKKEAESFMSVKKQPKDILTFALEAEKNSLLFYYELLSMTSFTLSHDLIKKIIAEEKHHIILINKMLNNL